MWLSNRQRTALQIKRPCLAAVCDLWQTAERHCPSPPSIAWKHFIHNLYQKNKALPKYCFLTQSQEFRTGLKNYSCYRWTSLKDIAYCVQFWTPLQERQQQTEANLAEEQQDVQEHLTCKERPREPGLFSLEKDSFKGTHQWPSARSWWEGSSQQGLTGEQEKTGIHWTERSSGYTFLPEGYKDGWSRWQGTDMVAHMGCAVSALGISQPQNSERAEQAGLTSQLTPVWVHLISSNTNSMKDENLFSLGSCGCMLFIS